MIDMTGLGRGGRARTIAARRHRARRPALALLALALAPPASAADCRDRTGLADLLTDPDRGRLERLYESRARGLAEALAEGGSADARLAAGLLTAERSKPDAAALPGRRQCRVVKLGGPAPLVAYGRFACEIREEAGGLAIEKLTGSQRFRGRLAPVEDGFVYRGVGYTDYVPERPYGEAETQDSVGCLTRLPDGRLLLELPEVRVESKHNLVELSR